MTSQTYKLATQVKLQNVEKSPQIKLTLVYITGVYLIQMIFVQDVLKFLPNTKWSVLHNTIPPDPIHPLDTSVLSEGDTIGDTSTTERQIQQIWGRNTSYLISIWTQVLNKSVGVFGNWTLLSFVQNTYVLQWFLD